MTTTFTINDPVADQLALMYFNPATESLKELTTQDVYFSIKPFEKVVRRFYLTGDLIYSPSETFKITVDTSDNDLYSTKIKKGTVANTVPSFNTSSNELTLESRDKGEYTNCIPVDILIESKSLTTKVINLNIYLMTVDI